MSVQRYQSERLAKPHDRSRFHCGVDALDRYFQQQVGQDQRSSATVAYVLVDTGSGCIAAYYTLSACSIKAEDIPEPTIRRLPKYPQLPAVLIGRLAVDLQYRGQGIGRRALLDALARCLELSRRAGVVAVVVDAKDERARQFYLHHDFIPFRELENRLFLPIKAVAALGPEGGFGD